MDVTKTSNKYTLLTLPERVDLFAANSITVENFKWEFDNRRTTMHHLSLQNYRTILQKIDNYVAVEPTDVQKEILSMTFGLQAASAMAQLVNRKAMVTTENAIQTAIMGSQIDKFDVSFQGGPIPTYTILGREKDENGQVDSLGKVLVVSGCPSYNSAVCETFKDLGAKNVVPAHSVAVNLGVIVGTAFRFGADKCATLHPFLPKNVKMPGVALQRLDTGLAGIIMSDFKHNPASILTIVADIAKKSAEMVTLLQDFEVGRLGVSAEAVQKLPLFSGRDFSGLPAKTLYQYHLEGYNALGKARDMIKNSDTGYAAMNAPLKWILPLEALVGILGEAEHRFGTEISYFGAAGGRARRMFEQRGIISAFDVKPSPMPSKKIPEEDFEKYKIDRWTVMDIFQMPAIEGEILVSDIYIDSWKKTGPDFGGHKFVSGILQGYVANNDLKTCAKIPPNRLVKGFLPRDEEYALYTDAYPFWAFRVGRPLTGEIIYLSVGPDNQIPALARELLEGETLEDLEGETMLTSDFVKHNIHQFDTDIDGFEKRWAYITNRVDHEKFVRLCLVAMCEELNFQQRKTCLDPRIRMTSPHNRNWELEKDDLPCLYVPKHMRGIAVNCIDSNSASFGGLAEGEMWGDDDVKELVKQMNGDEEGEGEAQDDEEEVLTAKSVLNARKKKADTSKATVIVFDDD